MKVIALPAYVAKVKVLLSATEREEMEAAVAAAPDSFPVIAQTGGFRKARWGRGSSGKSSGVRTIFFYRTSAEEIYFALIYPKNKQENLSSAQKKQLKALGRAIEEAAQG